MRIVAIGMLTALLAVGLLPAADASVLCSTTARITRGAVSFTSYAWTANGGHSCIGFVDGTLRVSRTGATDVTKACSGILSCSTSATGSTIRFFTTTARTTASSIASSATATATLGPA